MHKLFMMLIDELDKVIALVDSKDNLNIEIGYIADCPAGSVEVFLRTDKEEKTLHFFKEQCTSQTKVLDLITFILLDTANDMLREVR